MSSSVTSFHDDDDDDARGSGAGGALGAGAGGEVAVAVGAAGTVVRALCCGRVALLRGGGVVPGTFSGEFWTAFSAGERAGA
jgi:hypothetical protein